MKELVLRLLTEEDGQGLAEYALILVLVSIAVVGSVGLFRDELISLFENKVVKLWP